MPIGKRKNASPAVPGTEPVGEGGGLPSVVTGLGRMHLPFVFQSIIQEQDQAIQFNAIKERISNRRTEWVLD